jgi:ribosomal protein S18 acetylase RimI-like enzyme
MNTEIIICRTAPQNVAPLHEILTKCGQELKKGLDIPHWLPEEYSIQQMQRDAEDFEVYALSLGKKLVGTFTLTVSDTIPDSYNRDGNVTWQLENIRAVYAQKGAIVPEFQQKGIGSLLLKKVEELAVERGARAVRFATFSQNLTVLSFYERRKYKRVGEWFAEPYPLAVFEKLL